MSQEVGDQKALDAEQEKFMNEEYCILVDDKDQAIGSETKKECHLNVNIEKGMLHRAFSVFLFNDEGKLLLQKRADAKITFPDCWTNTCCSHPLFNIEEERNGVEGTAIAVRRKLQHELNIPPSEVPLENLQFLTKIHYKAPCDETWGEHEVDYIFFVKCPKVTVNPNPGEVKEYKFVTQEEVKQLLNDAEAGRCKLTPWFKLIVERFLLGWWSNLLSNQPNLPDNVVHRA